MLDNALVFSWAGIVLGALVFGFLFEVVFICFGYVVDGSIGLSRSGMAFGLVAGVLYVLASMYVRWAIAREESSD